MISVSPRKSISSNAAQNDKRTTLPIEQAPIPCLISSIRANLRFSTDDPTLSINLNVVCNVDRYFAESIESVLAQTFRAFEFIIIDFGSTDISKAIISKYAAIDKRIKLYEIPHCGLGEARNAACSRAQGKYVAIMDADDVCLPERLAWQVDFAERHPGVGAVGGGGRVDRRHGQATGDVSTSSHGW